MKVPSINTVTSQIQKIFANLPQSWDEVKQNLLELWHIKKIDKYIIRKFIGTYFFSIILIISIVIVIDTSEKLDNFYDHHAPLKAIIFSYYINFIPYFINLFSPLFTFIAVIFFTSKLADNTEIIAILSSGVSFKRLMYPYFLSAAIIAMLTFILSGYIIPPANQVRLKFENTYVKPVSRDNAHNVQMQVDKGVVAYIERYEQQSNVGCRFSLDKFEGKTLVSRMTADSIRWKSGYRWTVKNYLIRDFKGLHEDIKRGDRLDTTLMMQPGDFFITSREAPQMTNGALSGYINRQKSRGVGNTGAFLVEYYRRFANPLAAFILTLIGVSLSSRKVRGGIGLQIGIGIALSALYILFNTVSATFAANGSLPPLLAVWLPNIIFMIIGISLYAKAQE
ncbi:MAG: permease YjgP/YjgQ family protein [Bacteroidetes bacterium]|nr:permease YjgP/YjgQ family protein [Bacteroidota bacterium]